MSIVEGTQLKIREKYGKVPLMFIPNMGQVHENVSYYMQGARVGIYFTPEGVFFSFIQKSKKSSEQNTLSSGINLKFIGANPKVKIEGHHEGTGKVNYFIGNDPTKWLTGLSTYQEVVYRELWSGVDLVFRENNNQLKYEFVVQPGAAVEDILLSYQGASDLSLDEEGNLQIHTEYGVLLDEKPISFQEINREKVKINSFFVITQDETGKKRYGFSLGNLYDSSSPLIIDPSLIYSSYLGGMSFDLGFDIAVDASGNAYVTGTTNSPTGFPFNVNAFQSTFGGQQDVFVTKVSQSGTLIYSSYLGGDEIEFRPKIVVDPSGNAYVTGITESSNFPTINAFQPTYGGNGDAFVTKVSPTGMLIYSSFLGGDRFDEATSIAVDAAGNAYITGTTGSVSGFPTVNAFQSIIGNSNDAFVTKVSPSGTLIYSSYLGGAGVDNGTSIAVDASGNAYVTGLTSSPTGFPFNVNAFQPISGGLGDAFVTKVSPTGMLIYSSFLGGTEPDQGTSIAVDPSGNAYVTGVTESPTGFPFNVSAFQPTFGGGRDAFVTKVSPVGSLIFSSYLGGTGSEFEPSIAVDSTGNAYVTGSTDSPTGFPFNKNAFQPTFGGEIDAFVTKVSPGGTLIYSSYLGGTGSDFGVGIAVDASGSAYITGNTNSPTGFPFNVNAFQPTIGGIVDAFVTKVSPSGTLIYSSYLGGSGLDFGLSIAVDASGNAYVTGSTDSPTGFPFNVNAFQPTHGGRNDAFVTKIGMVCPVPTTVNNDFGECGAIVNYTSSPGAVCTPPSGSFFPVGDTIVTCTEGNQACSFTVTVNDTEPPTITCPANIIQGNDPGECGAVVNYPAPTVNDNCPGATAVCSPASGSFFPVGTTTVTCTATDASGNTAACSFTVTVNDTEPPVINCPADITVFNDSGRSGAFVNFPEPTVSDNCPGVTTVCTPASGSFFPPGMITVTCTATDAAGNTSNCSFNVRVIVDPCRFFSCRRR